jgi:hypothetical protein
MQDRRAAVRMGGSVLLFLALSGLIVPLIVNAIPAAPVTKSGKAIARANRLCPTLPALSPIAKLPAATILTFVDFGPRLIAVTHHRAIAGPYHRNGAAILDIQHAFRGPPEVARAVMRRHGATLLLVCPGMSESTIYATEAKDGLYARLAKGRVPAWLTPVSLPKGSPLRLWRVVDQAGR